MGKHLLTLQRKQENGKSNDKKSTDAFRSYWCFKKTYESPPSGLPDQRAPRRIATHNVKALQNSPEFSFFEFTKKNKIFTSLIPVGLKAQTGGGNLLNRREDRRR
jgi:hypothetical protein